MLDIPQVLFKKRAGVYCIVYCVMFSGKQTTARKMADHLKNCINQRAHGFYIHTYCGLSMNY